MLLYLFTHDQTIVLSQPWTNPVKDEPRKIYGVQRVVRVFFAIRNRKTPVRVGVHTVKVCVGGYRACTCWGLRTVKVRVECYGAYNSTGFFAN